MISETTRNRVAMPLEKFVIRHLCAEVRCQREGVAADTTAATDARMSETETLSPEKRICGVLAPVVTPFKADLSPDREQFISYCRWLLSQNCGLAPFGTTSEANSMSIDERISLLDALVARRHRAVAHDAGQWFLLDPDTVDADCARG